MATTTRPVAIFDFDGTLADSFDLVIAQYNRLAPTFRVHRVELDDLPRLRAMKPKAALAACGVTFWKLPLLVATMRRAMHAESASLKPFPDMVQTLRELSSAGVRCSILSTNASANIERFLSRNGLDVFEHVQGGASMFGKAKALKKLIQRAHYHASEVTYVGDEVRDVHAAKSVGVRSIGVSWGFADREALSSAHADLVLAAPRDLLGALTARV